MKSISSGRTRRRHKKHKRTKKNTKKKYVKFPKRLNKAGVKRTTGAIA